MSARILPRDTRAERGSTMVEVLIALAVVFVGIATLSQQISLGYRDLSQSVDRTFASAKAMAILAELQSGIDRGEIKDAVALAERADETLNPVLTTLRDEAGRELAPDHPGSGNLTRGGTWLWSRKVDIEPHPDQAKLRYARVSVFKLDVQCRAGQLATVSSLLALDVPAFQPTKVYDVYVLAAAQTPSLWQPSGTLRTALETAAHELQSPFRGIEFRLHWITNLGYGRDDAYVPHLNATQPADTSAVPWAYWYPGLLAGGEMLYSPELFDGRLRTEAGVLNDYDATSNPWPVAVADQFNHCARLPQARLAFDRRVAAGLETAAEPPLQILLEELATDPDRYRNAIFVNLHGAGLPIPPLRNYADAAKAPERQPGVRVVTHAARLWTPRAGAPAFAEFRVYGYKTDPGSGPSVLSEPITLRFEGLDLTAEINSGTDPTLWLHRLPGGVSSTTGLVDSESDYAPFSSETGIPPRKSEPRQAFEMCYEAGYSATPYPHTWVKLYNTPLTAPTVGEGGLPASERLYGLEYIPSPIVPGDGFSLDLASAAGTPQPRNTARWRLRVPVEVLLRHGDFDRRITVTTSIGDDLEVGSMWPVPHEPGNRTTTYTWLANSPQAVPWTERYQIHGDPRHLPYSDVTVSGDSFTNGYNTCFDDLVDGETSAASRWPCLDGALLRDGFGSGVVVDVPRSVQLWHEALALAGATFVELGEDGAHVVLRGGEIAAAPQSAPIGGSPSAPLLVHGGWFGLADPVEVDSMASPSLTSAAVAGPLCVTMGSGGFGVVPWLGELCPDASFADFIASGNLPTAEFQARRRSSVASPVPPAGSVFSSRASSVAGTAGSEVWLPGLSSAAASSRDRWFVVEPFGPGDRAYFSVLNPQPSAEQSANAAALHALLQGLHSVQRGGEATGTNPVAQQPLLEIMEPQQGALVKAGTQIVARWTTLNRRFDVGAKTFVDSTGHMPEADFGYALMLSSDDGSTWSDPDGSATVPGRRPEAGRLLTDVQAGPESFRIDTTSIEPGTLLIRVECYHTNRGQHLSSHQVEVEVR